MGVFKMGRLKTAAYFGEDLRNLNDVSWLRGRIEKTVDFIIKKEITTVLIYPRTDFEMLCADAVSDKLKSHPEIELRLVFPTIDDKYMKDMYGLGGAPLDEREDVTENLYKKIVEAADIIYRYVPSLTSYCAKASELAGALDKTVVEMGLERSELPADYNERVKRSLERTRDMQLRYTKGREDVFKR